MIVKKYKVKGFVVDSINNVDIESELTKILSENLR